MAGANLSELKGKQITQPLVYTVHPPTDKGYN
jgi:hypothetical protein